MTGQSLAFPKNTASIKLTRISQRECMFLPNIRIPKTTTLQCSCLENPRDGGAWWAAVTGVAQSQTRLKRLSSSSSSMTDKIEKNEQFQMPMKTWSNRNSHFWWECKMVEPLCKTA